MSYTIDTATKVHERQVAAVSTVQSLVVKAVDSLSGLTSNAPKAPEQLSSAVEKLAAPLTRIVGTPSELRAYAVANSRDWLEVQHKFQTALLDAMYPSAVTVETPRKTASKTN